MSLTETIENLCSHQERLAFISTIKSKFTVEPLFITKAGEKDKYMYQSEVTAAVFETLTPFLSKNTLLISLEFQSHSLLILIAFIEISSQTAQKSNLQAEIIPEIGAT
jgi:hypothetical protein